ARRVRQGGGRARGKGSAGETRRLRRSHVGKRGREAGLPRHRRVDEASSQRGNQRRLAEHRRAAARAGLRYVNDGARGIARRRAGTGWAYYAPDGRLITDRAVRKRIDSLAIPPAWTEVWICPDPDGHIQATARDARGRKQYRYHPAWTACRDEAKFSSLAAFGRVLPRLRQRVDADLARRGLPRERVVAAVV